MFECVSALVVRVVIVCALLHVCYRSSDGVWEAKAVPVVPVVFGARVVVAFAYMCVCARAHVSECVG